MRTKITRKALRRNKLYKEDIENNLFEIVAIIGHKYLFQKGNCSFAFQVVHLNVERFYFDSIEAPLLNLTSRNSKRLS